MRVPDTRALAALVFDFDHTLTDFGRGVDWRRARDEVFALYRAAGVDARSFPRRGGAFALIAALDEAVADVHSRARADATRAEAFRLLETHECAGASRASLLPGVAAALTWAKRAGLGLAIVSANAESAIRLALGRLGVGADFAAVVGRTPDHPLKPAPDMHREALRLLGCPPAAALAIGDSTADMAAATAAGMLAVGVAGGEGTSEDLFAAGACWVVADLTALPSLLALWGEAASR